MNLKSIEIKNYKSIESMTLTSEPRCQVFVGLNEAGKTNVLDAISLLSPNKPPFKEDIRIEGKGEATIKEASVEFIFELSQQEVEEIAKIINGKIYSQNKVKILLGNNSLSIEELVGRNGKGLFYCNLVKENKMARYYSFDKRYSLEMPLSKIAPNTKVNELTSSTGEAIPTSDYAFFAPQFLDSSATSTLVEATIDDICKMIGAEICEIVKNNLPDVIYWQYSKENLLPSSVKLSTFADNPDICIPLKNMFMLSNPNSELKPIITEKMGAKQNILDNFLDKAAEISTKYLRSVWKECSDVAFYIKSNGDNIDVGIADEENKYRLEQRSDGFKRFVTFLLMLSAAVKNEEIQDSIIIIDEPDIGLHISGQKYLLRELIKISEKNHVFFSTHSIFMVDKEQPSRHFIVEKKKEKTTIKRVEESKHTDDEVINNALGYSIFEALEQKNIIFEGWADKHLFKMALGGLKKNDSAYKDLAEYGVIHADGVKDIINIAKILELANRDYFVVSDTDNPAKEKKKKYEEGKCNGNWLMYGDFVTGVETLEDFVKHKAFKVPIEKIRNDFGISDDFDHATFSNVEFGRLRFILDWIARTKSIDKDAQKQAEKSMKSLLYSSLKSSQIEDVYLQFIKNLREQINP